MPGVYSKNKFDLAGFCVGIVAKKKILDKKNVRKNNIILQFRLVEYIQMATH